MLTFNDHSEHPIDAKGRLAIPARYRHAWDPVRDGGHWVCVPWPGSGGGVGAGGEAIGTLRLFTASTFASLASRYGGSLTPSTMEAELELTLFSLAKNLEMDAEGRVVLPPKHLAMTGIGKKVVVAGVQNRLEIHDAAVWDAMEIDRFRRLPGLIRTIEIERRGMGGLSP